jgi:hypothetical protein
MRVADGRLDPDQISEPPRVWESDLDVREVYDTVDIRQPFTAAYDKPRVRQDDG